MIRYHDHFGSCYLLREPIEVIDSAMFGPCFRAGYKLEDGTVWYTSGDFRLDIAVLIELVDDQLELQAAA
jgi:hypothetical protein